MLRLPCNNSQKTGLSWNTAKHWLALRGTTRTALMKRPDDSFLRKVIWVQKHDNSGSSR